MRKLVIAVIIFSFIGFGPLKSFFHSINKTNDTTLVQSVKESITNNKEVQNILTSEGKKEVVKQGELMLNKAKKFIHSFMEKASAGNN